MATHNDCAEGMAWQLFKSIGVNPQADLEQNDNIVCINYKKEGFLTRICA